MRNNDVDDDKFEKLHKQIFPINEKIRFVGIVKNDKVFYKMREGTKSYLTKKQTEEALLGALKRWEIRDEFKEDIGGAFYAMAMYEQTKRFTIRIEGGLLCISTEIDVDNDEIVMKVLNEASKVL